MTERTWLYFALLLGALAVGGLLLREPVLGPYRELDARIAKDNDTLKQLDTELATRKASRRQTAEVAGWFGEPLDLPGRQARSTWFYRRVETLLINSGLEVVSIQPKPDELDEHGVLRFPVVVSAVGDLDGLTSLLAQLRATTSLVGIDRLMIQRRDRPDQPNRTITIEAVLVSYGVADAATRDRLAQERAKKGKRS